MRRLFVAGSRLRSGWRVVSYVIVSRGAILASAIFLVLLLILFFNAAFPYLPDVVNVVRTETQSNSIPVLLVTELVQFTLIILFVFVWRNLIDRRTFRSLGLNDRRVAFGQFMAGAGLSVLAWLGVLVLSLATSAYEFRGIQSDAQRIAVWIAVGLVVNLLVGISEELDARGYILQNLTEGIGFWAAVLVSSLFFAAQHLLNAGANPGALVGTGLFGVLTALAYRATGQLWMPIGMHAAWNFLEGPVLGYLVSGIDMGGLFALRAKGPDWLTGGTFGPEGGVITWVPLIILVVLMYAWSSRARVPQPSPES